MNRPFKNANGDYEADFINCVAWRGTAENLANYQKKGNLIGIDGRVQTRSYEGNDGKRRYVTEVVAENVQFLQTKKQEPQSKEPEQPQDGSFTNAEFENIDLNDDDLPF